MSEKSAARFEAVLDEFLAGEVTRQKHLEMVRALMRVARKHGLDLLDDDVREDLRARAELT